MLTILCPITSRGCSREVEEQPIFQALLPSLNALDLRDSVRLVLGYDSDDAVWRKRLSRSRVTPPVRWIELTGLTGNITAIWNAMAEQVKAFEYFLPANDDLAFQTNPLPAIDVVRNRNGFGTCAFVDDAFPDWPTFYVVSRLHFQIFGKLYPVPWGGAHQDPWIADVYRPWGASEIDPRFKVHNRIGIAAPRFTYGDAPNYRSVVLAGRRRINNWLKRRPGIAEPLDNDALESESYLI